MKIAQYYGNALALSILMSQFNLDKDINSLATSLQLCGKRANILANNIANQNTPGFKAQDLDYKSQFKELLDTQTKGTTYSRENFELKVDANLKYRVPTQATLDGNTVDTQVEQADYTQNALEYKAILAFLNHEIQNLSTVIKGT